MGLIEEFSSIFGEQITEDILKFIVEHNLTNEFFNISGNPHLLLKFGVRYGILEIVKFLYIHKNLSYDLNTLLDYNPNFRSADDSGGMATSIETGSGNQGLKLQVWDKYYEGRQACIKFLVDLKKYSMYTPRGKQHIYTFNRKYKSHVLENY